MRPPSAMASAAQPPVPVAARARTAGAFVRRVLLHGAFLAVAVVAYALHEHWALAGDRAPALASLVAAGGFGLAPLRDVARVLLAVEGKVLHLVHGLGGLALVGLTAGGAISGGPLLVRAGTSPFAIMGAAQALMHQDHPRSRAQADALRRFASSLPELRELASSRDLTSPASARRAAGILTDLIGKAEALGETELRSDPGFQGALRRVTARAGMTLGLDAVDVAIGRLAASPAGATAVPDLRRRLGAARRAVGAGAAGRR